MQVPQQSLWIDPFRRAERGFVLLSDQISFLTQQIGLISPFDAGSLRPAAYDLHVGNEYYENDEKKTLDAKKWFTIPSNGLVYVKTKETFNIPYYLVARYSLRVTQVYRGLLIDNGLHVDPGYTGPIWIPVHNFTSQDRTLSEGEEFLSVEFNRTTALPTSVKKIDKERTLVELALTSGLRGHRGHPIKIFYKSAEQFERRNTPITPLFFWNKLKGETHISAMIASEQRVGSQIDKLNGEIEKKVERFQTEFDRRIDRLTNVGAIGFIGLFIATMAILLPILYEAFQNERQAAWDATARIAEMQKQLQELKAKVDAVEKSKSIDAPIENQVNQPAKKLK